MPAYAVFIRENVRDQNALETYLDQAKGSSTPFSAKALAFYGKTKSLEGPEARGIAIVEFPTFEDAEAWYASERYQEVKQHRHLGADYRVMLVQGL